MNWGVTTTEDQQTSWVYHSPLHQMKLPSPGELILKPFDDRIPVTAWKQAQNPTEILRQATMSPKWNPKWHEPPKPEFVAIAETTLKELQNGRLEKFVAWTNFEGTSDSAPSYRPQPSENLDKRCHFYFHLPNICGSHGITGLTPEPLFFADAKSLELLALAGTSEASSVEVDQASPKDNLEHQVVLDHIRSTLLATWPHSVGEQMSSQRKFGSVTHQATTIKAFLNDPSWPSRLLEFTQRLHPTPAVAPYPRSLVSTELLEKWAQDFPRPWLGGMMIYQRQDWPNTRWEAWVLLRLIHWKEVDNHFAITQPVGAGMNRMSTVLEEWQEIIAKRDATRRILSC